MRRRRLVFALVLANALVMLEDARLPPPSAASLRAQRLAAQRAALAAGRTTYTFETRWTPPIAR